jgi:glyoxylase-like metal-dependent hydrolase (beta-lactamase superfamily II)
MTESDSSHRLDIGNINITAVSDGVVPMPIDMLYPDMPGDIWDQYRDRFPEAFGGDGFMINLGSFVIKSGDRTILVDTGVGQYSLWPTMWPPIPEATPGPAELMNDLKGKGFDANSIDTVFLTHLHGDHVGWNLSKDGDGWSATFPEARYLLQQADWEHFIRPEFLDTGRRDAAERNYLPLDDLGVLDLIEGDYDVANGLTAIHAPGHTPGHMGMLISSGNERALIIGDIAGSPMHISEPDLPYSPDFNAEEGRASRQRLLDMAEKDDMIVLGSHMTRPGWGRLIRWEGKRYWQGL